MPIAGPSHRGFNSRLRAWFAAVFAVRLSTFAKALAGACATNSLAAMLTPEGQFRPCGHDPRGEPFIISSQDRSSVWTLGN
jgi:hypothetical protein